MKTNIPLLCDSYKLGHWKMYPLDIEYVYSYFEARQGAQFNKTVFFGLQYLLKKHFSTPITKDDVNFAEDFTAVHLGSKKLFNREMWDYIVRKCGGLLPVRIEAVPEGTPVDVSNVLMTVQNTDPKCAALTNHMETVLSHVWGPSTVATLSREVKTLCKYYLERTGGNAKNHLPFMLHDFGFRGVNQVEAAGISGAGHLINFMGTDTIVAMLYAQEYYSASFNDLAFSVPASEHSVMTAEGEFGELNVLRRLFEAHPTGILSIVIDSYDYRRFITEYVGNSTIKQMILERDGKTVFRPDSGDPTSVTIEVLQLLEKIFMSDINMKGFKKLNEKVGVLWGDGIDYNGIRAILYTMFAQGWAADNIVFGMGGGLLQKINRDTQRFAFKSSAQKRGGEWHDIWKKPIDVSKASKKGRLALIKNKDKFETIQIKELINKSHNQLQVVFENGRFVNEMLFKEIRKNAEL